MEYQDEMKSVTVRVANGSGVIVQPLTNDCFYILTAHHVVKEKSIDQIKLAFLPTSPFFGKVMKIRNIYSCDNQDAAILVVERNDEKIICFYPSNKRQNGERHWHTGYPNNQNGSGQANSCKLHDFNTWLGSYEKYIEYKYPNHIRQEELDGMSGGGIFDDHYHLIGVHKQLAASEDKEQLGKNVMIPLACFEAIIAEKGLPSFDQRTFGDFKNDLFNFDDNLAAKKKLQVLLLHLAQQRSEMLELSPQLCYELFQKGRRVMDNIRGLELKKDDWVKFGEFLLAMKVVWDFDVCNHLEDVFPKFQYVQSDKDFDIYEASQHLDPRVLGIVSDPNVVFVIGGIHRQGYKQDVRHKDIPDIAVGLKPNQEFDIARTGREALCGFTYVNSHYFKDALEANTDEICDYEGDKLELYRKLVTSKI